MANKMRRRMALTLSVGLLLFGLTGCGGKEPLQLALTGGGSPSQASPDGMESHTVILRSWRFDAATVVIGAGTTLRFRNRDPEAHTVQVTPAEGGAAVTSGEIDPEQIWTYTFATPGSYALTCVAPGPAVRTEAPAMIGLVVVQ